MVKSLNSLKDNVTLAAGANVAITPSRAAGMIQEFVRRHIPVDLTIIAYETKARQPSSLPEEPGTRYRTQIGPGDATCRSAASDRARFSPPWVPAIGDVCEKFTTPRISCR